MSEKGNNIYAAWDHMKRGGLVEYDRVYYRIDPKHDQKLKCCYACTQSIHAARMGKVTWRKSKAPIGHFLEEPFGWTLHNAFDLEPLARGLCKLARTKLKELKKKGKKNV
jgi:hypothetical protein